MYREILTAERDANEILHNLIQALDFLSVRAYMVGTKSKYDDLLKSLEGQYPIIIKTMII